MGYFGGYFGGTSGTTTTVVIVNGTRPVTVPVPSPYAASAPEFLDHTAAAISRLCEQFKEKAV